MKGRFRWERKIECSQRVLWVAEFVLRLKRKLTDHCGTKDTTGDKGLIKSLLDINYITVASAVFIEIKQFVEK